MDLILWRHAEAEDATPGQSDMERPLSPRGRKQAKRMAAWLDQVLPESCRILVSPARRCVQTMDELNRKYRLCPEIAPDCSYESLLQASQWPQAKGPVMLVGHQHDLGALAGKLLTGQPVAFGLRKASVWWLASRENEATGILRAVLSPELAPK